MDKKIDELKQRLYTFFIFATITVITISIFLFGYYQLKILSLIGGLYVKDSEACKLLLQEYFVNEISKENIELLLEAAETNNYDKSAFKQLFSNYEIKFILILLVVIFLIMTALLIWTIVKIKKTNIAKDIDDIVSENEELKKRLNEEVVFTKKINAQMQDFTENIAHQVKTPLTAITLDLEILNDKLQKNDETVEHCFYHIKRMEEFVRRLLNISRLESGKTVFRKENIVLNDIMKDSVVAIGEKADKVVLDFNEKEHTLLGDAEWLKECFINIITNSLDKGNVFINVDTVGDKCIIHIEDNGNGFEDDKAEKIFNRFETERDSNTFHTGIGLNLSKLIVEAHYGTIQAKNSDTYGGACFRIVIPIYILKEKSKK
ncbi:MAG: HAMP domain-containing histidine kinase [Lachnospira sp.]|nr:HAMP domain-containing histidine kinase [Lachnospira sp.]